MVIAYAIDRLSRDPVHLGVVLSEAEHAGVEVVFVTEPLDSSPEGQLIRFVRGYAAKIEHEKIRERSMRGQLARVQSGKLLGAGRALYGYRWRDGRGALELDPVTAPVARRIFMEVASGKTLRRLATELTSEGIPTPKGGHQWSIQTLHSILHHPNYTGHARAWWRRPVEKRTVIEFDEAHAVELPEGTIPPLVDQMVWEAVQHRLQLNKAQAVRNNKAPENMLLRVGYVRCGYCGRALVTKARKNAGGSVVRRYCCSRITPQACQLNMATHILDAAVWDRVSAILTQPEIVAGELERLRANDPTSADLEAADRALAELERRQSNIARAIGLMSNPDALSTLTGELEQLSERKQQLQSEREGIRLRRKAWSDAESQIGNITLWCNTVAARLGELSYEEKRLALEALGVQVTLYGKEHEPRYVITANIPLEGPVVSEAPRSCKKCRASGPLSGRSSRTG